MGRMAILKIVVAGVLIFVLFSALIGGDEPDLSPQFEFDRPANELRLRDPMSASTVAGIGGSEYLLVMTKFGNDRTEPAYLRIVEIEPDSRLDEVGWLHTSMSVETPPTAIAAAEDHVYVGLAGEDRERPALWVVDVSNPENPFEANLISVDMPIRGLAASEDGFLVASGYDAEFLVFNIRQPNEPELHSSFTESIAVAPRITMHDSMLLVDHMAGVVLLEFGDQGDARRTGEFEHPDWIIPGISPQSGGFLTGEERFEDALPEGNFLDADADGDLMIIASSDDGLVLVDISNPNRPAELATLGIDGRAARIAIDADRVYALGAQPHDGSDLRYNLYSIDIMSSGSPRILNVSNDIVGVPRYQELLISQDRVVLLFNDTVIRSNPSH